MRITTNTFKSFIRKNKDNLFIRRDSKFDGMTDCVRTTQEGFAKVTTEPDFTQKDTYNIQGLWLVRRSGDYFEYYEDEKFYGYEFTNSCGSGIIATPKQSRA